MRKYYNKLQNMLLTLTVIKTRKNSIVEYLDYQIPVNQREMEICKQQSEIKMRPYRRYTDLSVMGEWAWKTFFESIDR